MTALRKHLGAALLAATFAVCVLAADYRSARDLLARVQTNLQHAAQVEHNAKKDTTRYDNALRHLSDFDRKLSKNKFDKDKLDQVIDDIKNVVNNNTLSPDARDALTADLQDLRALRSRHD